MLLEFVFVFAFGPVFVFAFAFVFVAVWRLLFDDDIVVAVPS